MIELGLKITCEVCLRSEVQWIDPPQRGRIALAEALQDLVARLIRSAPGWRKVRQDGARVEMCPECRATLGLVVAPAAAPARVG